MPGSQANPTAKLAKGPSQKAGNPLTGVNSPRPAVQNPAPGSGTADIKSGGTITAGDSKAHCIIAAFPGGVLDQSALSAASNSTGINYNCLGTFANPMPAWSDWEA